MSTPGSQMDPFTSPAPSPAVLLGGSGSSMRSVPLSMCMGSSSNVSEGIFTDGESMLEDAKNTLKNSQINGDGGYGVNDDVDAKVIKMKMMRMMKMMMLVGLMQPIMWMTIAMAMATMAVNDYAYNGDDGNDDDDDDDNDDDDDDVPPPSTAI